MSSLISPGGLCRVPTEDHKNNGLTYDSMDRVVRSVVRTKAFAKLKKLHFW